MADDTDLIAAIYDAAIDPAGWDDVVKRIVAATGSISGALVVHAADTAQRLRTSRISMRQRRL
jgi:hypothetical protein